MKPAYLSTINNLKALLKKQTDTLDCQKELSLDLQRSLVHTNNRIKNKSKIMFDRMRRSRSPKQVQANDDIYDKLKNILGEKHLIKNDELQGYDALNKLLGKEKKVEQLSFKRRKQTNKDNEQMGYRRINSHNQIGFASNRRIVVKRQNKPLIAIKNKFSSKKELFGLNSSRHLIERKNSSKSIEKAKKILSQKGKQLLKGNKSKKNSYGSEISEKSHVNRYRVLTKNLSTSHFDKQSNKKSKFNTLKSDMRSNKNNSGNFRDLLLEILNRRKSSGNIDKSDSQLQEMLNDQEELDKDSEQGELDMIESQISEEEESEQEDEIVFNINESVRNIFKGSQESDDYTKRKESRDTLKKQLRDKGSENISDNNQIQAYSYNKDMIDSNDESDEYKDKKIQQRIFNVDQDSFEEYDI